jgi:hypothetical protein
MDGQRFDDLARILARPATRRGVWGGALGVAAGWFATGSRGRARAQGECAPPLGVCDEATPCCDAPNYACCDGTCTLVLDSDTTNCGSCGNTCEVGALCCGGNCVDPNANNNNCGSCGHVCNDDLDGSVCVGGECQCPPGEIVCQGCNDIEGLICTNPLTSQCCCGGTTECAYECVNGTCVCLGGVPPCGGNDGPCCPDGWICTDGGACEEATGGTDKTPVAPTPTPTSAAPVPEPTSTTGPVALPSTGAGTNPRPSGGANIPLLGAAAATFTAVTAWLRKRERTDDDSGVS